MGAPSSPDDQVGRSPVDADAVDKVGSDGESRVEHDVGAAVNSQAPVHLQRTTEV